MSDSFEGRYTVAGPRVYIHPDITTVRGKDKDILFRNLPAGIFVWVECSLKDHGVGSHWADIKDLVDAYHTILPDWNVDLESSLPSDRRDEDHYPL